MDVDIDHGAGYGVKRVFAEGKQSGLGEQKINVVTDVDVERLTAYFVKTMQAWH